MKFVRYADDCNIFVASRWAGERVMKSITRFVEGKLKLKVNREKSAVDRPWRRKFLGFSFLSIKQATIRLAPKTISRFKEKIRELRENISLTDVESFDSDEKVLSILQQIESDNLLSKTNGLDRDLLMV